MRVRTLCAFSFVTVLVTALVLLDVSAARADDCRRCGKNHAGVVVKNGQKAQPATAAPAPTEPVKPAPAPAEPAKPASVPASGDVPKVKDAGPATEKTEPKPVPEPAVKVAGAPAEVKKEEPKPEPEKKAEPEVKPAPAVTPKPDEPKGSTPLTPKKPEKPAAAVAPPAAKGDEATKGDPDEEMVLIRPKDIAAAAEAVSDAGFSAGYAYSFKQSKRYRVMTREEAIELGLKTAREVIEKRLGPKPAKP